MSERVPLPLPSYELMDRVAALDPDHDPAREYDRLGRQIKEFIVDRLPEGWTFEGKRVLDFGCGAGRVLRQFRDEAEAPGAEFWGAELDEPSVRFIESRLSPPFRAVRSYELPPVPAPEGHFDLIYAMSVFTHLTEEWSAWAAEMHRLLATDGLLLFTFLGEDMSGTLLGERWDQDRIGINFAGAGIPWDEGGPLAFMSAWWIRAHWGRGFDVLAIEGSGYDSGDRRGTHGCVLLRRREAEISPARLEAAEPGEERELLALRHNVRQLARELTRVRRRLEMMVDHNHAAAQALEDVERHWRETAEWWEDRAATSPVRRITKRLRWTSLATRLFAIRAQLRARR